MDIVSGAGHDACYVSRVAPTAMIFVPCKDGISHNEIEDADKADIGAGAQILLQAMVERANSISLFFATPVERMIGFSLEATYLINGMSVISKEAIL